MSAQAGISLSATVGFATGIPACAGMTDTENLDNGKSVA
jgi:hypothetical protein